MTRPVLRPTCRVNCFDCFLLRQAREGASQSTVQVDAPGHACQVRPREVLCVLRHSLSADLTSGADVCKGRLLLEKMVYTPNRLLLEKTVYTPCRRFLPQNPATCECKWTRWAALARCDLVGCACRRAQGMPCQLFDTPCVRICTVPPDSVNRVVNRVGREGGRAFFLQIS